MSLETHTLDANLGRFETSAAYTIAQAAMVASDAPSIIVEPRRLAAMASPHYSHRLVDELKATSQASSGRCWIFAALNVLRYDVAKANALPADFEISQPFVYFYDKIERVNYFLEQMIELKDEAVDSRLFQHVLTSPLGDGGQWDMLASVVLKYGLVPKSVYGETFSTKASRRMNRTLTKRLRCWACEMRAAGGDETTLRAMKARFVEEAQRILLVHLGTPPSTFDWTFTPKKKPAKTDGDDAKGAGAKADGKAEDAKHKAFVRHAGLTPLSFLEQFCGGAASIAQKVSLVHDPRNPYFAAYTVSELGNVVGGQTILYLNVPIVLLKRAVVRTIRGGKPVWFGCDVGKCYDRTTGVMDTAMWRDELVYGSVAKTTKVDRLRFHQSLMTHAMVFTGFDEDPAAAAAGDADAFPLRYRVENSWGEARGDKGYNSMSAEWFDEYVFQVAVDASLAAELDPRLGALAAARGPVTALPPWDPLGSLAM